MQSSRKNWQLLVLVFCFLFFPHKPEKVFAHIQSLSQECLASSKWPLSIVCINSVLHLLFPDSVKVPVATQILLLICKMV